NPLGPGKISGTVAVRDGGTEELAVGIEDFHPIVESVGDVNVAVLVEGHTLGRGKISRFREEVVLAGSANLAQQLEAVCVVNQHLVLLGIHDVKKPVLLVDRQSP